MTMPFEETMATHPLLAPFLLGFLCSFFLFRSWQHKRRQAQLPLPPGPKPLPLLGNVLDIPTSRDHLKYTEWGKTYGDVVHVSALGKHIIVLNSAEAANELLDRRSAVYSDRPYLPLMTLMNADFSFASMGYTERWKRYRRLFVRHVNPSAVTKVFSKKQQSSVHKLLRQFLETSASSIYHQSLDKPLRYAAADIAFGIAYGYDVNPEYDPLVDLAETTLARCTEGFTPKYLVNVFPVLRHIPPWFPGATFHQFAAKTRAYVHDLIEKPYQATKERIASGNAPASFVHSALADLSQSEDPATQEHDIKEIAATMYLATTDTAVGMIHAFLLQMVLHPNIQQRAQAELDTLTQPPSSSSFRLPTFDDRAKLPYMEALLKEAIRWNPTVATGAPHGTTEEDTYRGWRIPKGAIVFPNAWGMLRDDKVYRDPYVFDPDRFVGSAGRPAERDPGGAGAFGFGRRVCAGRLLGENTVWLHIACLLSAFTFSPAKDSENNDIDVRYAQLSEPGFLIRPPPFPCTITPRGQGAIRAITETA